MFNLSALQIKKIDRYCASILEFNKQINLTAITDMEMFHVKHVVDSLACLNEPEYVKAKIIADMGTGAGFPGIPLAIASPDKEFVLIDSLAKRLKIIDELCKELDIKNVKTLHGRAEDIGQNTAYREKFDLSVSRAVARLDILSEWCLPLLKVGGSLIAFKGMKAELEVEEAKRAIEILGGRIERIEEYKGDELEINKHALVIINKIKHTPSKYPRKPGKAKEQPIK